MKQPRAKPGLKSFLPTKGVMKKKRRPTAVILGYDDFQRLADLEDRYESALLTTSLKEDRFLSLDEVSRRLGL